MVALPCNPRRSAAEIQVYSAPACQEIDQGFLDELSQTLDGVLYRLLAAHTSHNEMDPDNAALAVPVENAHYLQDIVAMIMLALLMAIQI